MQRFRGDEGLRKIEFVLYNASMIRSAVYEAKSSKQSSSIESPPSGRARIADPTPAQAIKNMIELTSVVLPTGKRLTHPERWLTLVDKLTSWAKADELMYGVYRARYSGETYQRTMARLGITLWGYNSRLTKIRNQARLIAVQLGLVDVLTN